MTDKQEIQFNDAISGLNLQMLRDLAGQVSTQKTTRFDDAKEVPVQIAPKPPVMRQKAPQSILKTAQPMTDVVTSSETTVVVKSVPDNMMAVMNMNLPKQTVYLFLVLLVATLAIWYLGTPAKSKKEKKDEDEDE